MVRVRQCGVSVTFWYGFGSRAQYLCCDQRIRILLFSSVTFKMATKNYYRLLINFLKLHLHHFSKIKVMKKSQNSRNSYYFCYMIKGSGSVRRTNGSGSATLESGMEFLSHRKVLVRISAGTHDERFAEQVLRMNGKLFLTVLLSQGDT